MLIRLACVMLALVVVVGGLRGQEGSGSTLHVVQRGENLFRIGLRYGLTADQVAQANDIENPNSIFVGQRLLIPLNISEAAPLQEIVHVVQAGETLSAIAELYNVDAAALAAANATSAELIYAGQLITIPGGTHNEQAPVQPTSAVATIEPLPLAPDAAPPAGENGEGSQAYAHVVERGESLFTIANDYGVEVMEIIAANPLSDPSVIYPGQALIIPGVEPTRYAGALPAPMAWLTIAPLILIEGQTARIDFATTLPVTAQAEFMGAVVPAHAQNQGLSHVLFLGVPLGTPAGLQVLTLTLSGGTEVSLPINLQVNGGGYRSEALTLSADRLSLIDPNVDAAELGLLRQVMATVTPDRLLAGLMGLPAAAPLSSPFGSTRNYNNGAFTNLHTGTDFAAASGAPILAPAAGRVVLADTLNVRGMATVLDHGWGVYTGYWHQSERYVALGDVVQAGQVIGAVGSTGRVTGAHLHWELWVNGVPVDPMQWVSEPLGVFP